MSTVREYLEEIRDLVAALDDQTSIERECGRRAEAAICLLNHAPSGAAAKFLVSRTAKHDRNYALVLDPIHADESA